MLECETNEPITTGAPRRLELRQRGCRRGPRRSAAPATPPPRRGPSRPSGRTASPPRPGAGPRRQRRRQEVDHAPVEAQRRVRVDHAPQAPASRAMASSPPCTIAAIAIRVGTPRRGRTALRGERLVGLLVQRELQVEVPRDGVGRSVRARRSGSRGESSSSITCVSRTRLRKSSSVGRPGARRRRARTARSGRRQNAMRSAAKSRLRCGVAGAQGEARRGEPHLRQQPVRVEPHHLALDLLAGQRGGAPAPPRAGTRCRSHETRRAASPARARPSTPPTAPRSAACVLTNTRPASGAAQPFTPVTVTPSTNARCARKKSAVTGSVKSTQAAIISS